MLIGSDRFAALRSRAGRTARARCIVALPAGACVLAFAFALAIAGCGGSSHTSSTAAADVNGAPTGGASATGTSTAGAAASGTQSGTGTTGTTTTTSSGAASGQGQVNGAGAGGAASTGGTVRNGPNDPASSHGGSSGGRGAAHGKSKATSKTGRGSSGSSAGSGTGSGAAGGSSAGSGGGSGSNANSGVPFEVTTTSMEPTYQPETKIYYDPTRTHPQIGEVVVYYVPVGAEEGACGEVMAGGRACATPLPGMTKNREISFKRVVGLPGDSIAIRAGHVIRNGQPEQPEPPTMPCEKYERLNCEFPTPIVVPPGHYYLMADNRGLYKEDSRIFGAVPQEYILGTVDGS